MATMTCWSTTSATCEIEWCLKRNWIFSWCYFRQFGQCASLMELYKSVISLCDHFSKYFVDKFETIRSKFADKVLHSYRGAEKLSWVKSKVKLHLWHWLTCRLLSTTNLNISLTWQKCLKYLHSTNSNRFFVHLETKTGSRAFTIV